MSDITTLEDVRKFFTAIELAPECRSAQDSEEVLGPLLEALAGWDNMELAELLLHVAMTLAIRRGEGGIEMLREALTEMAEVLQQRQVIWGNPN